MKNQYLKKIILFALLLFAGVALRAGTVSAATFTVTSAGDAGAGTLRQAITDANAAAGADQIDFSIGGSGTHTIELTGALPYVEEQLTINGLSQPGAVCSPTQISPAIVLHYNYSSIIMSIGHYSPAIGSEINGIAFSNGALDLNDGSRDVTVRCNTFGTIDGTAPTGQATVYGRADHATIHQNIFATNSTDPYSVTLLDFVYSGPISSGHVITGNYFGTDPTLTNNLAPHGNAYGILLPLPTTTNRIGGASLASDRNHFYNLDIAVYSAGSPTGSTSLLGNVMKHNAVPIVSSWRPPIIRTVTESSGSTHANVELDASLPAGTYRLELFSNPTRYSSQASSDPNQALRSVDTSSLVAFATVTKTIAGKQTISADFGGTGYTYPTITATQDVGGGSFGQTSSVGEYIPLTDMQVQVDTHTPNRCFLPNTSTNWDINLANNGPGSATQFILPVQTSNIATVGAPSLINGTAITDEIHVQQLSASSYLVIWRGTLSPGQTLHFQLPVTYGTDTVSAWVRLFGAKTDIWNAGSINNPIDYFDEDLTPTDNQKKILITNCDTTTDFIATSSLELPGLYPGQAATYVSSVSNHGPANTQQDNWGGVIMFVPRDVTYNSVEAPVGFACQTSPPPYPSFYSVYDSQYSQLVFCQANTPLSSGDTLTFKVHVTAGANVSDDTQFATYVQSAGDPDLAALLGGIYGTIQDPLALPINDVSLYRGLGRATPPTPSTPRLLAASGVDIALYGSGAICIGAVSLLVARTTRRKVFSSRS